MCSCPHVFMSVTQSHILSAAGTGMSCKEWGGQVSYWRDGGGCGKLESQGNRSKLSFVQCCYKGSGDWCFFLPFLACSPPGRAEICVCMWNILTFKIWFLPEIHWNAVLANKSSGHRLLARPQTHNLWGSVLGQVLGWDANPNYYPCGGVSYFVIFTVTWFSECGFCRKWRWGHWTVKSIISMLSVGPPSDDGQNFCGKSSYWQWLS